MFTRIKSIKLMITILMLSSMTSICFSQKVISENNDTLICFDINQSKYILKQMHRTAFFDTIHALDEAEIKLLKITIQDLEMIVQSQKEQLVLNDVDKGIYKTENKLLKEKNESLKKEIRLQKFYKWVSIGVGTLTTSFMTYLYLVK